MQEETRKKVKEVKNYTQALGELKCAYSKKKWLKGQMNQNFDLFYFKSILVKCV